ncbi:glycosyl hydrolase family 18 protein [Alicyclobacillus shizuokensis]|uniref:glycosyl hydrolase family 18 protein n=1 Tax=Alicyclobacillus shizuokensis TaxID=392014 RepID=UPI0008379DB2|nr:glycosyl hydrolase family 18 protein [Alicyclobacillus shizuokensis]MCL6625577.1 glycoside hydrolase [Alicyclobacillus shizuokensis]
MRKTRARHVAHSILTCVWIVLLGCGCLGGVAWIYGEQGTTKLEASRLATAAVTEWVGTPQYEKADQVQPHSLMAALGQILNLPFTQPVTMITSQLPATQTPYVPTSSDQAGLFQTITQWESKLPQQKPIAMGWIPYNNVSSTIEMIRESPGITVISPKWLTLNSDGSISSRIQPEVVQYAHQHGISVWALVDNQFRANLTHQVLSSPATRRRAVQQLVHLMKVQDLDGLNIDFENVYSADEDALTQFVEQLHKALAPLHKTLSIDITTDIVFLRDDAAYFHAGLAAQADYIALMAYDEHWGGDKTPGPVADVPWVTQAVEDLLNTGVPANKVILGVPFYGRFWYVHKAGWVSDTAVALPNIDDILRIHHATAHWDGKLGVATVRYPKPDGYEVGWYDTPRTLAKKLNLVSEYGLAGVAVWSLSLSDKQTWTTLTDNLRQALS